MITQPRDQPLRPLDEIPGKEGFVIIGVRADHSEAPITVAVDASGKAKIPGASDLIGWRYP